VRCGVTAAVSSAAAWEVPVDPRGTGLQEPRRAFLELRSEFSDGTKNVRIRSLADDRLVRPRGTPHRLVGGCRIASDDRCWSCPSPRQLRTRCNCCNRIGQPPLRAKAAGMTPAGSLGRVPHGYTYSQFCELNRGRKGHLTPTMRQTHIPGAAVCRLRWHYACRHRWKAHLFGDLLGASTSLDIVTHRVPVTPPKKAKACADPIS
jgi:hypothetical protein